MQRILNNPRVISMKRREICFGIAALFSLLGTQALASPTNFQSSLQSIESELNQVENDFAVRSRSIHVPDLEERLQDGIVLQASGDHQRAEYIFMDIVSHEEWRGKPSYQAAQLQLARSLYEDGYYRLSQKHLLDLLQTGVGAERTDGVMLLLQVVQHTGDWAEVNMALANATDFSKTPAYLYIMGRAMFLQNEYETAFSCLQSVGPNQDEWSDKSDYLLGVLNIQIGDFDTAMRHFQTVAESTRTYKKSKEVHTLAQLAMARLYYEQTQWSKAIEAYQKVSETSEYFPAVLYEMGWTHIRLEDYQAAQQKFELLLLSYPNDRHALETRRLLADIKRELGQYDEAVASYQTIVDEFEPIMSQMEHEATNLSARKKDLRRSIENEQYNEIQIVPERAKGMVEVGEDVDRVETMLQSLTESDSNTSESEKIVEEINAVLQSSDNVRNLPEFQQFTHRASDLRINTLLVAYDFTKKYQGTTQEIEGVIDDVTKLPRTQTEREILASYQTAEREEREARLHRLKLETQGLKNRIRILESWIDGGRAASLMDDEKERIKSQIAFLSNQVGELNKKQGAIESKLVQLRSSLGAGGLGFQEGQKNADILYDELETLWSQALSSGKAEGDYRSLIERSRAIFIRINGLNKNIDESLNARVADFKARLNREAELVNEEKNRFASMKSDVGTAAGEISVKYWQYVYEQVRDMVLNADLGMVDIAWLRKDARSKALAAAMEERKKEREVLEQDFRQFLKESGQD